MLNEYIEYDIDPARMWVKMAVKKPEGEEELALTADQLLDFLQKKGVKTGINRAALEALSSYVQYNREVVVARGREPVNGKDGYHRFLIEIEDSKAKPVVAPDGSVDYLNSLKIAMVEKDQVFAEYIPPTLGEYGCNVFSEMIHPVPGKNIPGLKGKGFTVSPDGKEYMANLSGRIYMDHDRVIIDPIYNVSGDLGIQHGNIRFNGDVNVQGDMHSGLSIEAEGSVFISGHVGNCTVKAGGNITVGKGIQGKFGCEITAGGDVAGNFVEHCNITAGGNVYANSLLGCNVFARNAVIVTSRLGCIIGGNVHAVQEISAKVLGNDAGIVTNLAFGESAALREEIEQAKERKIKVEQDIRLFDAKLKQLSQMDPGELSDDMKAVKRQLAQAKVLRQTECKELEKAIGSVEEEIVRARSQAHVRATGAVYPGVVIRTEGAVYVQEQAYRDVFYKKGSGGTIRLMSPEEYNGSIKE